YYVHRRHHDWWKKYDFVLAVALDAGAACCVLIVAGLQQAQITGPKWKGSPDLGKGQSINYYCFE
ncbi:hypothetical protein HK104_010653, partial [Borealophlyctis nickersoniae]